MKVVWIFVGLFIMLSCRNVATANDDTLQLNNKTFIVKDDGLYTLDGSWVVNCGLAEYPYTKELGIFPFTNIDSLRENTKDYDDILEIEEHTKVAKRTGFILFGTRCRKCAYCYKGEGFDGKSKFYGMTVSYIPAIIIEYIFNNDGTPRKVFVVDTLIRNPRNILQATEIQYGSCNDTIAMKEIVLRYDEEQKDLYWIADGYTTIDDSLNRIKRRQLFIDGIIREEEVYMSDVFVTKIIYPSGEK